MGNLRYYLVPLMLFSFFLCNAQDNKFTVSDSTKMTITGTSTLHDWTSQVNDVSGSVVFNQAILDRGSIEVGDKIESVVIVVQVASIISPRGATMDKKTYNALKMEEHPQIRFNLSDGNVSAVSDKTFTVTAGGELEVAGVKKKIQLSVTGQKNSAGHYVLKGSHEMNMTEYEMEPPSAMFGQIVTGEKVIINFELVLD